VAVSHQIPRPPWWASLLLDAGLRIFRPVRGVLAAGLGTGSFTDAKKVATSKGSAQVVGFFIQV